MANLNAAKDMARDLSAFTSQISTSKGEANAYLRDPTCTMQRLRLEKVHPAGVAVAVEASSRVRLYER